jgi:cobalt-zinc-cadmium efflux system protein
VSLSLARRRSTVRRTYGLQRTTLLAALLNGVLLLIAVGGIGWVIGVAAVGVLINSVTALLFAAGRKGDLNIRGRSCTWQG